jgi:hypothetical protein
MAINACYRGHSDFVVVGIGNAAQHQLALVIGVNLLQSGITRWCLMENIMRKLGAKSGD